VLLGLTWNADGWHFGSALIYGMAMVACFGASTAYHAGVNPRVKEVLRRVDHAAIYLLIAGTYTPFALLTLPTMWGGLLLTVVWALALLGIIEKFAWGSEANWPSVMLYTLMGWLALFFMGPLIDNLATEGVGLLVAGGAAYTGGIAFFMCTRLPFHHLYWHISVMVGAACHFGAVLYAL
jgi:hemolysin III